MSIQIDAAIAIREGVEVPEDVLGYLNSWKHSAHKDINYYSNTIKFRTNEYETVLNFAINTPTDVSMLILDNDGVTAINNAYEMNMWVEHYVSLPADRIKNNTHG